MRVPVAGFNTGGYDQFFATHYGAERRLFATHYGAERRPLEKGDVIAASYGLVMRRDGK